MQKMQIDPITGFIERYACMQLVSDLVDKIGETGRSLAVLWIDLDRFRQVNDSFGYARGDRVLSLIAERIREKAGAAATLARMGGDEFVCLLPVSDIGDAKKLAAVLLAEISQPLNMDDFRIRLTASIGISMLEPEEGAEELLERTDWSKITAKNQGGNCFVISGSEQLSSHMGIILAREDLEVEYLLNTALENGGLQLHYQPVLDFDGNLLAVEGLMRCSVNGKNIPPSRFFPIAEKSGLIVCMGEWSLLQGTNQARVLSKAGMHATTSINVSRGQLSDGRFAQSLQSAIILARINPELIELELSESLFMDATEMVQENLHKIRDMGVGLTIDNFGAGLSCLANLKDIPATKLKLGRAFTMTLPENHRSRAVVNAMVKMGKDLGMTVIAEGVETREQMEILRELDVDGIQGYYNAKPMDVDTLSTWLNNREYA